MCFLLYGLDVAVLGQLFGDQPRNDYHISTCAVGELTRASGGMLGYWPGDNTLQNVQL